MTDAERMAKRYELLKRQRLCVRCKVSLPPESTSVYCQVHLEYLRTRQRGVSGSAERNAKRGALFEAQLAKIIETAETHTLADQVRLMGISRYRAYHLRRVARTRGFFVPSEQGGNKGAVESPKWRELEASTARCKCGLLLPCHSCVDDIRLFFASSRRGPGRVYPTGGPTGVPRTGTKG